jgi:hypothetical protein
MSYVVVLKPYRTVPYHSAIININLKHYLYTHNQRDYQRKKACHTRGYLVPKLKYAQSPQVTIGYDDDEMHLISD